MTPPARVAVVDDAPDVRVLLSTVLEAEGFEVVGEAANGVDAVALAEQQQPEIMLLDLSMPKMDGLEALPLVLEASPTTAVVMLSGFINDEVRAKAKTLGAAGCVEKGIRLDDLLSSVRDLAPGAPGREEFLKERAEGNS